MRMMSQTAEQVRIAVNQGHAIRQAEAASTGSVIARRQDNSFVGLGTVVMVSHAIPHKRVCPIRLAQYVHTDGFGSLHRSPFADEALVPRTAEQLA